MFMTQCEISGNEQPHKMADQCVWGFGVFKIFKTTKLQLFLMIFHTN